jgi:hypothetical protein
LARLRETETSDSVGGFALSGGISEANSPEVAAPLPAEARLEAQAQTALMHRHFSQGQHNEAFQVGRLALARWHALQEHEMSCEVLRVLSLACMEHEQGVEALALARHALRLARARVLPPALVRSLSLLALLHGQLHDVAVGETLALQALSRARELPDRNILLQTLDVLLCVLLEAHEVQRLAGDTATMQATVQRMQRHANHALAQSGPLPDSFDELQLRIHAAACLLACGRATDAAPVLSSCTELARQADHHGLGLWARLYGADASMRMGNDAAAQAATQMLAPQMTAEVPPRLRLACLSLQALLAERAGAEDRADELRLSAYALRDSLLRQRFKLRATLRRNADDVMQTLSTLDREWQERGISPHAVADETSTAAAPLDSPPASLPPEARAPDVDIPAGPGAPSGASSASSTGSPSNSASGPSSG